MNENDLYKIVGKNIKKYRKLYCKKKGLMTQEMLAEAINVSVSFISSLESNKTVQGISITTLYKISVILNTPMSKFFDGASDEL